MEDSLVEAASAVAEVAVVDSNVVVIDKVASFSKEISYIKNERIKESANVLVGLIPDYFFHEAASSTGKYHPSFSLGEGGLLRHTKAAVRIARELLINKVIGSHYTSDEKDLIYLAIIMHDSIKRGDGTIMYAFEHPLLASNFIKEHKGSIKLTEEEMDLVCSMIETHMGEWTTDYYGNKVLEEPTTKYQKIVHMCDYLASKKFLDIKFNDKNDIVF